ncbi:MAG: malto-oligosyltrehalose synthase, partial [Rhizobacter sp.]|nr:malto-oligosyltrehalose synthase [Rhizobacter sp.]
VGLNPLHALFPHEPSRASPYSPSHRNALNVIYIDVEAVPDFMESDFARSRVRSAEFQQTLSRLREAEFVDYDGVWAIKQPVLEVLYAHFRQAHLQDEPTARGKAFRAFQTASGKALRGHALFEALQAAQSATDHGIWGWPRWPTELQKFESSDVKAFEADHEERVEFYEYLQWQATLQLRAAGDMAAALGMPIGLYRDLAVGSNEGGSETWINPSLYALSLHVGAPPEDSYPSGQDWGLPPMVPQRLREQGYQPFIDTLQHNMRGSGALRLDHVMGLMRLFWVHPTFGGTAGAYMGYPLSDMLGILALESQRRQCLVIGEDLGNVAPSLREALKSDAVLSYRPFYFERAWDSGGYIYPPAQWPVQALAVVSTHDLPTLRGFWRGQDIDDKVRLKLYPSDEKAHAQIVDRAQARTQVLLALESQGLIAEGSALQSPPADTTPEFTTAVHTFLGRTASQLLAIQLEDVLQQVDQVNIPGTTEQMAPNWRRKLSLDLEALAVDPRMAMIVNALQTTRPYSLIKPDTGVSAVAEGGVASGVDAASLAATRNTELPAMDTAPIPQSTYRVQFHAGFTFKDAIAIVPYLKSLGISHLYASPYLKARAGSTHGYDIVDHNLLNPEIGTEEDFELLCSTLADNGMKQILDIVPNHMGVLEADNVWWLDVLENGPSSAHAETFDIDWTPPAADLRGQVLIAVLGDHYGVILENGELKLSFDATRGEFWLRYYDHRFPIDPADYPQLLAAVAPPAPLDEAQQSGVLALQSLLAAFGQLPSRDDVSEAARATRWRDAPLHKQRLAQQVAQQAWIVPWIDANLALLNGTVGDAHSFDALDLLVRRQAYRLAFWRAAGDKVNYRRFFDINTLAALRMEREPVFEATHRTILKWLREGKLAGLRIDHPDGLSDPGTYLQRLQSRHVQAQRQQGLEPKALYVLVEKILAEHERMPPNWPTHGDTGYRFSNQVNGVFVNGDAAERFDRIYTSFVGHSIDFDQTLEAAKRLIALTSLGSDLTLLTETLFNISQTDRRTLDYTRIGLRAALIAVAAGFPVYRSYITGGTPAGQGTGVVGATPDSGVSTADRQHIEWAAAFARRRARGSELSAIDYLVQLMLHAPEQADTTRREAMLRFTARWQQFTAPVMAKAMEDTAFYRWHRFITLNDVGGDPRHFGLSVNHFHAANLQRCKFAPHTLLGTTTHDTKRSEDVRARLDVLSEVPREWRAAVGRWSTMNRLRVKRLQPPAELTRNDEYLLYQTLVGVWPLEAMTPLTEESLADVRARVQAYMLKAVREAKDSTSWTNPDEAYEKALAQFIDALLGTVEPNPFLTDFRGFVADIAPFGCYNSLGSVTLKLTSPGVPDIYQGCESWMFSLVDPDNRRPVDFDRMKADLQAVHSMFDESGRLVGSLEALRGSRAVLAEPALSSAAVPVVSGAGTQGPRPGVPDGQLKMLVTTRLLQFRNEHAALFRCGTYLPLTVIGPAAAHVVAFARTHGGETTVTVVGRLLRALCDGVAQGLFTLDMQDGEPIPAAAWTDSWLVLPVGAAGLTTWRDVLTGFATPTVTEGTELRLPLGEVLARLPVAVLQATA